MEYSTNLAADICLSKMVAELLSHPNSSFVPPKIIGIHFSFITKIPGDTLVTKMAAELPSTEQIFLETSRFVLLETKFNEQANNHHSTIKFTAIQRPVSWILLFTKARDSLPMSQYLMFALTGVKRGCIKEEA